MQRTISRRAILKGGLIAGTLVPAFGLMGEGIAASALPALDTKDPTANALGYLDDTTKVDASANPTHKADQRCDTCAQFIALAGEARGTCNIFPGKTVANKGWCKTWSKKTA
jgi:high potential iron-sulfur protein